jgi:hypothetical protein
VGSLNLVGLASSSAARSPVGLPPRRRMTAGCAPTGGGLHLYGLHVLGLRVCGPGHPAPSLGRESLDSGLDRPSVLR